MYKLCQQDFAAGKNFSFSHCPKQRVLLFSRGSYFININRKLSCICIAWYKHWRGWENSQQLCKPSTLSRVCITVSNSPNTRLCQHGKRFLLLKSCTPLNSINSYLAARLGGIKQKKSSWGSITNNTFLLFYFPNPRSQLWILIYRKWSIRRRPLLNAADGTACVAWRFWLGALSNKGGWAQRNREEISPLCHSCARLDKTAMLRRLLMEAKLAVNTTPNY